MAIALGEPTIPLTTLGIAIFAPAASGVYAICDANNAYVYFGESNDIQRRLTEHLNDATHCIHRHGAASFTFDLVDGAFARILRQNELIAAYRTPCNQMMG